MSEKSAMLAEKEKKVKETMATVNEKLDKVDSRTLALLTCKMTDAIKEYNLQARNECFSKCMKTAHPVEEAARVYSYDIIVAKRRLQKGVFIGYTIGEDVAKINLLELCEYSKNYMGCEISDLWGLKVENMGQLLTKRNAYGVGKKGQSFTEIDQKYRTSSRAKSTKLDNASTPYTTTQLVKLLQEIIDAMLFIPGDKNPAMNKYRVNSRDVYYFDHLYSTSGKDDSLKVKSTKALCKYMFFILHRLVCNLEYNIDYNGLHSKAVKTTKPVAEPETTPAPAAEVKPEDKPAGDKPEEAKAEGKAA